MSDAATAPVGEHRLPGPAEHVLRRGRHDTSATTLADRGTYVVRPRLDEALDGDWLVAVLVAPPGYGKSMVARAWVERTDAPVASVSVDRLAADDARDRIVRAAQALAPRLGWPLRRDGQGLVEALAGRYAGGSTPTLVVDCPQPLADSPMWDVLTELVDGGRSALRVLIMCQVDPPLPIVRWRAEGTVRVLRESDLRFEDDEALGVARAIGREIDADAVFELNRRVDGWPLAFTLALMAIGDERSAGDDAPAVLVDALVAAAVDVLGKHAREAALALSVLEWFDDSLATALIGYDSRPVIAALRRHHLVEPADPGPGVRFHRLVRELLEAEFRWRDPALHSELHQRAARHWLQRGHWDLAYRHLGSLRDRDAVHRLVVEPALALVDRGDRAGLGRVLAALPRTNAIDDAAVALDLSTVSFFAGDRHRALRWVERAETLGLDEALVARAHSTRAILALMDGRLADASHEAERFLAVRSRTEPGGPLEVRFALVMARLALVRQDVAGAQHWIDTVAAQPNPDVVCQVTVPGLQAWHDSLVGLTHRAVERAAQALACAEALGCSPHHGAFDATVAAAWASLRTGKLAPAEHLASRALADAALLGYDWNTVRSAEVAGHVHLAAGRPHDALGTVDRARRRLADPGTELAAGLVIVEAAAMWRLGRGDVATDRIVALPDRPDGRLLRAAIALESGDDNRVVELLGDASSWLLPERIEAALLIAVATADDAHLAAVVEDASVTGLMLPFLRQGRRVEAALLSLSLEAVHPALIAHLRRPDQGVARVARAASLTAREQSILDLLPSHFTYSEIADQLDLSVNTVKGNLKSIYRKLEVTARAEAVHVARATGIV